MTLVRTRDEYEIEEQGRRSISWNDQGADGLALRAEELRLAEVSGWSTWARRLIFVWFRIHVVEREDGKWQRVNVRIPLPIPLVGGLLRRKMSQRQAMKALLMAHQDDNDIAALERYLESIMALELIRVEEMGGDEEDGTLVVLGLD